MLKPPLRPRVGLLGKFAFASLIPIVLLGFVLAHYLSGQIQARALTNARQAAVLSARLGIQPLLSRSDLEEGLTAERYRALDTALQSGLIGKEVAQVKIWSRDQRVIYSDDRHLVGRRFPGSEELESALAGQVASEISDLEKAENTNDRAYGKLLEVYVPLRFAASRPAGAFEIYLPYGPIEAAIARETRTSYLLLLGGLGLLYATLFRLVASASKKLRRQAEENRHQALHDDLTDLPNRSLFRDRVQQALRAAERDETCAAVMLIDLDRFKDVNDTLGHQSGDRLLRELGPRVGSTLRASDTVARLGGDEFAVLLPQVQDAAGAVLVADKLRETLARPFAIDELVLEVEASVGIALFPEHGSDVDTLLQHADVAMYRAKEAHAGIELYALEHDHYSPSRLALVGELRHAIANGELILYYQPKAYLRSGEVSRVEALVRWEHPKRGLLTPAEFIPRAEQIGLMRPLTLYVLERALRQCRAWQEERLELAVAVNLSARDLLDLELPDKVAALLKTSGVDPGLLEVEITESTILADPLRARAVLLRLSELGVRIAIDDFGSGYSSLGYLKRLPVDVLKIDKSFVVDMESDDNDATIVRSTIDLGHNLGLEVVAEGVESEEIWNDLARLGCDIAQGYYLGRPMPPEVLPSWLEETRLKRRTSSPSAVRPEARPRRASG